MKESAIWEGVYRGGSGAVGNFSLTYPLPNLALGTKDCEIWEGVCQGVLIADFRN